MLLSDFRSEVKANTTYCDLLGYPALRFMAENSPTETPDLEASDSDAPLTTPGFEEPKPSYVKLAMRNMVRKGGKSIFHFTLTVVALMGILVGLSYLTR